jgi:hemoglobin
MAAKEKSLYERLGGKPAITAVVDDFVARVAADRRINRFFANTDITPFKARLVDQICEASGGPCKYTGQDMQTAHQGMGISNADFDALVEDLVAALEPQSFGLSRVTPHGGRDGVSRPCGSRRHGEEVAISG